MPAAKKKPVVKTKVIPPAMEIPPAVTPPPQPVLQPVPKPAPVEPVATSEPVSLEQMLEDSAGEEPPLEKTNKVLFALGTIIALGLIAGSIAIFLLYLAHPKQVTRQETAPVEEATPSAVPVVATNKSDITFEVLNGSGVAGTAGKAASTLVELGYTIGKTGNAEKRYTKSEVTIAASVKDDGVAMLLADLEKAFSITSSSGVLQDSTFSARLIIGKK
jgi:LytR cell envelope-related transcriptional attenuator